MRSIHSAVAAVVLSCGILGGVASYSFGDTYLQGTGGDHAMSFKHDRFYTGVDRAFHAEAYDFSGVGFSSDNKWVTMISPRYFVSAAHYHPGTSGSTTVTFYEGNTTSSGEHTYTIDSWSYTTTCEGSGSDLWLGRLTAPIPDADNIAYFPVLDLDESDYPGLEIYTYGKPDRVGLNHIDEVLTRTISPSKGRVIDYDYVATGGAGESESYLMVGDSGGPSFVVWNDELALVGVHWYHNTSTQPDGINDYSGDTFVPYYITQLNANMGGDSVTTVPEPGAMILLTLGAMGLLRRRRRHTKG